MFHLYGLGEFVTHRHGNQWAGGWKYSFVAATSRPKAVKLGLLRGLLAERWLKVF